MPTAFLRQWFFVPLLCTLVGLYSSIGEYFNRAASGQSISLTLPIADKLSYWLIWAMLSPLISTLAKRFLLERPQLRRNLIIHVLACVFCAIFSTGLHLLFLSVVGVWTQKFSNQSLNSYFGIFTGIIPNVLIYWIILAINLGFYHQWQYKNELLKTAQLDAQLSAAQLRALKMQLQPHFLFNTLNSITALVLKNENRDAIKMIARLSDFLRLTLDNTEAQIVPLKDELEFTKRYLAIEQIRFQEQLTIITNVDSQTLNAQVPNFILQPLVENAVRHGAARRSGASLIEIVSRIENNQLYLEVCDSGEKAGVDALQSTGNGVGLKNTRARLEQLYGKEGGFTLFSDETSNKTVKTTAQIVIPFASSSAQNKN